MLDLPSGDFLLHIVGIIAATKENRRGTKIFMSLIEQERNLAAILLHYSVKQETNRSASSFLAAHAVLARWYQMCSTTVVLILQYHSSLIFVCIPFTPLFAYGITCSKCSV